METNETYTLSRVDIAPLVKNNSNPHPYTRIGRAPGHLVAFFARSRTEWLIFPNIYAPCTSRRRQASNVFVYPMSVLFVDFVRPTSYGPCKKYRSYRIWYRTRYLPLGLLS